MSENIYWLTIQLSREEKNALVNLANSRERDPASLVTAMVHRSLEEYGLIPWRPDGQMLIDDQSPE